LAWEHFFPSDVAPWLVDYTEDRDLWRWVLEDSREVNAGLRSYPLDFEIWDAFYRAGITSLESLTGEGAAILRAQQQIVDGLVSHAIETEIDGHKVLMVNATCHVSEVAGELAKNRPFGVVWFEGDEGERVYSLRSDENGIDVSEIAKAHGGGGHARAAGFRVPATGATGLFTEGRMSDDDEGELQIAIGSDLQNKLVRIDFGKPTAWVAFPKEVALALSRSLASKAEQI
ncbi:MAG: hypothetical protein KGL35_15415, partial [Bradyrhizobium sp.]|nr:hypothetical protein [Bradyrhizobium sp.]